MEISKRGKKIWLIIGIALIIIAICQTLYNYYFNKELHRCNKVLSTCYINETNYIYIKTSGLWVYYKYIVDNKEYNNRCNLGLNYKDDLKNALLYKIVPLVYCKQNPAISTALITPEFFKDYGYKFPDSLKWVLQYKK